MTKVIKKRRRIVFVLEAPYAKEVILMADFNNWNRNVHPMKQNKSGLWDKIVVVPPGRYEYKFLVDNEWWHDPENQEVCYNKYGTLNSVITIQ